MEEIRRRDTISEQCEKKMVDAFGKGISILNVQTGMADGKEAERERESS